MISSPHVATFTGITFPSHLSLSELGLIRALTAARRNSTNCCSSVCFNDWSRMVFDGTPPTIKPSQITVAPLQRPYGQHHVVGIWKPTLSLACLPLQRPVCQACAVHLRTSLSSARVQITGSSVWNHSAKLYLSDQMPA